MHSWGFNLQSLANTVWAFASLAVGDSELLDAVRRLWQGRLEVDVSLTYPGTARSNIRLTEEAVCWLRGTQATAIY